MVRGRVCTISRLRRMSRYLGGFTHRRDDLAGLADLHVVGHEPGVDGSARRTHGRVQLVRQLVQQLKVLPRLQPAAWHRGGGRHVTGEGTHIEEFRCFHQWDRPTPNSKNRDEERFDRPTAALFTNLWVKNYQHKTMSELLGSSNPSFIITLRLHLSSPGISFNQSQP